jgi:voltage-dependent potassium channel beta subunit
MLYRQLGKTGIQVSVLSYGNFDTAESKEKEQTQFDLIKLAWENGVNFFDTAEAYGFGVAEKILGKALKNLNVERSKLVVSTKLYWTCFPGPNVKVNVNGLSRKHLIEGMRNSLSRLQMDYVDIVFCHRPDFSTPLEEVCRGMSYLVDQGHTFYWGTSEWPPCMIARAVEMCKRLNLHGPKVEQCEYSLLIREKMEREYRYLFREYGMGTTIWSPLKSGLLTGKYNSGEKLEGTRMANNILVARVWEKYMSNEIKRNELVAKLKKLEEVAKELGGTLPQLAIAWTVANLDTSTCLLGASKVSQLKENLKSLELLKKWTPELDKKIDDIIQNKPEDWTDYNTWGPMPPRRMTRLYKP